MSAKHGNAPGTEPGIDRHRPLLAVSELSPAVAFFASLSETCWEVGWVSAQTSPSLGVPVSPAGRFRASIQV